MESSSLVDDCLSPESTVTSLLSSSGHLRSSLRPPEHDTTIRYRDKDYDSASAALDAYISDFDRSCQNCRSLTGSLVLHNGPSSPTKPRVGSLRNRDVLRERLTDRELDFLNLPVSSLHHRSNRDRYSMTTNELLSIPYDGSMPVTHTSAFVQGLPSWSEAPRSFSPTFRHAHRTSAGLDNRAAPFHLNQTSDPIRPPSSSRCRGRAAMLNPAAGASSSAHRAADLHIPHWLTSNKAELNCSEISSLPDLKYPAWIRRCDVSEPDLWDERVSPPTGAPRTVASSWISDLEKDNDPNDKPAQVGQKSEISCFQAENQQTLRFLRLQLAEQISVLAAERTGSDSLAALFRDNRIESLIQKAEQVLNSLSGRTESPADPASSVHTEDLLPSPPPRCPPLLLDSAAGGLEAAPADGDVEVRGCGFHRDNICKQPGPVEAMKQMLFRLQSVEAELQRQKEPADPPPFTDSLKTPEKQLVHHDSEFQSFHGPPSLQRALHHLNRLKLLLEEPRQIDREEGEEKEEDEGRYSSSSADRLLSSQQEPS
uniref:Chromosome 18 open reading frame 54 n=1 Tax=Nothobranchius pienaari TaxID=704102 RepID=A0A1A8MK44_9TELE